MDYFWWLDQQMFAAGHDWCLPDDLRADAQLTRFYAI